MELPHVWFGLSAVVGIVFWALIIWLAWMLVSSIKGIQRNSRRFVNC